MTNRSGLTARTCSITRSRLVSVTSSRLSLSVICLSSSESRLRRMARILIWRSDSSPETYKIRNSLGLSFPSALPDAISSAICSSRVDLPMPGSPPTRTIEPGTIPPPSTRANSPMGMVMRDSASPSISVMRRGTERAFIPLTGPRAGAEGSTSTSSTMVSHPPH